jgi:hypothetical protein
VFKQGIGQIKYLIERYLRSIAKNQLEDLNNPHLLEATKAPFQSVGGVFVKKCLQRMNISMLALSCSSAN